jgi:hypothetical protein
MKKETEDKNEESSVIEIANIPLPVEEIQGEKKATDRLVPPHKNNSRLVTNDDMERLAEESKILYRICLEPIGIYNGAYAMHHSQIEDKDPLNFFVTQTREIIINPVIVRHSNYTKDSKEGCMSYPTLLQIIVPRWQKIEVEFFSVKVDPEDEKKFILSEKQIIKLSGRDAFVFQHEVDHANSQFIYQ